MEGTGMIRDVLDDLFSKKFLDEHLDEWGIVEHCDHPTSLGYSTTITPRTIYEAVDRSVDVIVTQSCPALRCSRTGSVVL